MTAFLEAARADFNRCLSENAISGWRAPAVIWREVGLQAVLVYRVGRLLRSCRKKFWAWPLLLFGWLLYAAAVVTIRKCYGIRLLLTADIGAGFWVGHFGGVEVVNCHLGENCSVGQQTHVGRAEEPDGPQIGNGVWIGAHAKIFGPTRVGDGSTIAPGARVMRNVPRNALVAGNPGRVAFRGYSNAEILPRA